MSYVFQARSLAFLVAISSLLGGAGAFAQATPTQILDRVNVVSLKAVLNMAFDDPAQATPFDNPPAITTSKGFTSCQLTPTKGLVCLDQNNGNPGRWVRRWNPVTATGESPTPYLFSCEDPVLGLDTSRSVESCTGITADAKGNTVVSGKRKSGYNLIKVDAVADLPAGAVCSPSSTTWRPLSNSQYCYKVLLPRDRPLLVDIAYTTLAFPGGINCTGVLGLEDRKTLMFFQDADGTPNDSGCSADPVVIADSKTWGLGTKELLQGATTLTFPDGGGSFALVVSNIGRVLAKQTDLANSVRFEVPLTRTDSTTKIYPTLADIRNTRVSGGYSGNGLSPNVCDSSAQQYGIRTSTKSGTIYVTDRSYCESTALRPAGTTLAASPGPGLVVATFPAVTPPTKGSDLTLGTQLYVNGGYPAASQYPALEPTLAPGISVDLSKCSGTGCTLTADGSGTPTATLSRVTLAGSATGMTLFQVRGMPDCRWLRQDNKAIPSICNDAIVEANGTVLNSSTSTSTADTQFLDVSRLLPKDVTDQFATPLPQMLLQPQYRAQVSSGRYTFDGFFGIPDKGVQFRDTFDLELYVKDLAGNELGCPSPTGTSPVSPWPPGSVVPLLPWDLTVRISEKAQTVGGPAPLSYTGILANIGCGSTKNSGGSFSIYAFNLELATRDNLTFVKLLVSEFYDLYYAQHRTAMVDVDENYKVPGYLPGAVPLTSSAVPNLAQNLDAIWYNAKDKLSTCIAGSNAPKKNEAVNNCQAFDSQMANYFSAIPACTSTDPCYDVYNRRGELKARVRTIRHIFNDRMVPSMPPGGFDPNYPISSSGLPPP